MGDRGAEVLADFLSRPDGCILSSLSLAHTRLRDRGLAALASGLDKAPLKRLDLSFNGIQDVNPLAIAVRRHLTLTYLNLEMNGIEDISELALAIGANSSLSWCSLLWNKFDEAAPLATAFASRRIASHLLTLCGLSDGQAAVLLPREKLLSADGVMLASELAYNQQLTLLDLSFNELGPSAATALAAALGANSSLTRLNLEANRLNGTHSEFGVEVGKRDVSGILALAKSLTRSRLTALNLSHNAIDEQGARAIGKAVASAGVGDPLHKLHVGSADHALPVQRLRGSLSGADLETIDFSELQAEWHKPHVSYV